ncbi:Aquaporin-3,Aquaporin-4,Aquaporin-9,Aquaporin-7,Aquaporin-1,Aquaporin-2 [Mytilus edulis]|uniref:Aquaporin-3,Aquaporin-4,Aquaporin-9,Aquaporin-7,A quaporin-1,Aquaporin-2 n=1 Tax=Mytilus edulis TaxID=6550 RepID=A0A8S3SRA8_MYTED|nr:Aquaporin-3,Aquaporin-4,Aquaporin-9,Aquaporin-7,Aquaporin-1,Aquaporin-2 [Mytilus edulis]
MEGFSSKVRIRNNIIRETFAEFLGTFTLIVDIWRWICCTSCFKSKYGGKSHVHTLVMGYRSYNGSLHSWWHFRRTFKSSCYRGPSLYQEGPMEEDALNSFDGGNRMVSGPNGTAGIWATYPQDFASVATCIGDQLLGTAMLLCCVLAVTDDRNMETHKGLIPFSIGLIVVVIGMTYHLNCGYAINPARDLGPRIFTAIAGWGLEVFSYNDYKYFWIPVLGPHVGAILGAFLYQFLIGFHWSEVVEITSDIPIKEIKNTVVTEKAGHTYDNRSLSPDS